MGIILEDQENLLALLPGIYQTDISQYFLPCCLGVTNNGFLVIYNDWMPDSTTNGDYTYSIKKKVKISNVPNFFVENVEYETRLKYRFRLNFIATELKDSFLFYYKKDAKVYLKKFFAVLKKHGLKPKKRTAKFS